MLSFYLEFVFARETSWFGGRHLEIAGSGEQPISHVAENTFRGETESFLDSNDDACLRFKSKRCFLRFDLCFSQDDLSVVDSCVVYDARFFLRRKESRLCLGCLLSSLQVNKREECE